MTNTRSCALFVPSCAVFWLRFPISIVTSLSQTLNALVGALVLIPTLVLFAVKTEPTDKSLRVPTCSIDVFVMPELRVSLSTRLSPRTNMFLTFKPSCICSRILLLVSFIKSFLSALIAFISITSLNSLKLGLLKLMRPLTARSPSTTNAPPTLTSLSVLRVSVAKCF